MTPHLKVSPEGERTSSQRRPIATYDLDWEQNMLGTSLDAIAASIIRPRREAKCVLRYPSHGIHSSSIFQSN